jgi:hypothetical protein
MDKFSSSDVGGNISFFSLLGKFFQIDERPRNGGAKLKHVFYWIGICPYKVFEMNLKSISKQTQHREYAKFWIKYNNLFIQTVNKDIFEYMKYCSI